MRNALFVLGQLTDLDADWLARTGGKVKIAAGTTLIAEGRSVDAVFVVLEGDVVATLAGRELRRLGPGEILGEMSFIDARLPSATVKAATECVVLRVPREALERRLKTDDGFAARFYRAIAMMLSDRLRSAAAGAAGSGSNGAVDADELDPNVLDTVALAGNRFARLVKIV
jgi:CRP-like cAMP-binding protein